MHILFIRENENQFRWIRMKVNPRAEISLCGLDIPESGQLYVLYPWHLAVYVCGYLLVVFYWGKKLFPGSLRYQDVWKKPCCPSRSQAKPVLISPKFPRRGLSCWMIKDFLAPGGNEPSVLPLGQPKPQVAFMRLQQGIRLAWCLTPTLAPNSHWPIPLAKRTVTPLFFSHLLKIQLGMERLGVRRERLFFWSSQYRPNWEGLSVLPVEWNHSSFRSS